MSNLVSNYNSEYTDETLSAQNEFTLLMRRSNMYEFIFLFIIALIVLVITIRNLASDTTTTAGYVVCCIILVVFFGAVIAYVIQRISNTSLPWNTYGGGGGGSSNDSGPIIRIHYV